MARSEMADGAGRDSSLDDGAKCNKGIHRWASCCKILDLPLVRLAHCGVNARGFAEDLGQGRCGVDSLFGSFTVSVFADRVHRTATAGATAAILRGEPAGSSSSRTLSTPADCASHPKRMARA
jgi:hypothetical protein